MSIVKIKKVVAVMVFATVAAAAAVACGIYVYPVNPTLVWILLFVCWACFRLRLRAVALFSTKSRAKNKTAPRP